MLNAASNGIINSPVVSSDAKQVVPDALHRHGGPVLLAAVLDGTHIHMAEGTDLELKVRPESNIQKINLRQELG